MADETHVNRLRRGVSIWNAWRKKSRVKPDLSSTDFSSVDLSDAELYETDLTHATLIGANLTGAALWDSLLFDAKMGGATLHLANLSRANLTGAMLHGANLIEANLFLANFARTNLDGASLAYASVAWTQFEGTYFGNADFSGADLYESSFLDVDLSKVRGLASCRHHGPSKLDYRTLQSSANLPLSFLRGVGLPDALIEYLPAVLNRPIQHYSCFISYSTKDQNFADRLYADLQNKGVRCWFAPHDMPIGGKIIDEIDSAIRLRDKVFLILSEHSIKSDWVEDEVTKAFEEERKRGRTVLFPIRLDDAVMDTNEAWAGKLRARHIGDFTRWKDHDAYSKSFERVLRDLKVKKDG
jgi:hypothetical protein